jgi:hypothetical protein
LGIQAAALTTAQLRANAYALSIRGASAALALIGGPIGAAAIATIGIISLASATSRYKKEAEETAEKTSELAKEFKNLTEAQRNR